MIQFKEIPGFPGYRAGDDGSVWTCRVREYLAGQGRRGVRYVLGDKWSMMKPSVATGGYLQVVLWRDGEGYHKLVHRLILEAFIGPCPKGMECRHFPDDSKANCQLKNLSWATKKKNQNDRVFHDTHCRGERHGIASMTNELAKRVRKRFSELGNKAAVAREFGLTRYVVSSCVRGRTYRDAT